MKATQFCPKGLEPLRALIKRCSSYLYCSDGGHADETWIAWVDALEFHARLEADRRARFESARRYRHRAGRRQVALPRKVAIGGVEICSTGPIDRGQPLCYVSIVRFQSIFFHNYRSRR